MAETRETIPSLGDALKLYAWATLELAALAPSSSATFHPLRAGPASEPTIRTVCMRCAGGAFAADYPYPCANCNDVGSVIAPLRQPPARTPDRAEPRRTNE